MRVRRTPGQAGDRRVGDLGRAVAVTPVDQGGGAGVERVERAHQIGDVDVVGLEMPGQPAMHRLHVFAERPVAGNAAQPALPGVDMGVDQAGQHDHAGRVDDLGVVGLYLRRDRCDAAFSISMSPCGKSLTLRVHRDDRSAFNQ